MPCAKSTESNESTYEDIVSRFVVVCDGVIKWTHFRVTGLLWEESNGHRWIPLAKASDTEWSALRQTVEITIETPVIRDVIVLIMTSR